MNHAYGIVSGHKRSKLLTGAGDESKKSSPDWCVKRL